MFIPPPLVGVELNDPISVQMQSTFMIKNHNDANFESYLLMMRRRKQLALQTQNLNSTAEARDASPLPQNFEKRRTLMR